MATMKGCPVSWLTVQLLFSCLVGTTRCYNKITFQRQHCKYLVNSTIRSENVRNEAECGSLCSGESSCASVNYVISGENQGMCELNDKTMENSGENVRKSKEFDYLGIVKRTCSKADEMFHSETKQCASRAKLCRDLLEQEGVFNDGVYNFLINGSLSQQYCHMTDILDCGGRGWTLVMKLNGAKSTFNCNSPYWTNKETYAVAGGLEGLTDTETKLESYWNTPFTKICVGMKVDGATKRIKLDFEAGSLYSVIADGAFRNTSAGRSAWKSLINGSSLQPHCNKEGFNLFGGRYLFVRLGIKGNDHAHCSNCDSWIGFGVSGRTFETTGNHAGWGNDNGDKNTPGMGYILVS